MRISLILRNSQNILTKNYNNHKEIFHTQLIGKQVLFSAFTEWEGLGIEGWVPQQGLQDQDWVGVHDQREAFFAYLALYNEYSHGSIRYMNG